MLYAFVAVLAIAFIQPPPLAAEEPTKPFNKPEISKVSEVKKLSTEKLKSTETIAVSKAPASKSKAKKTQKKTPKPVHAKSCEAAIAQVWPAKLQDGARLVALKESSLRADSIGGVNYDGSQDFGCFQINNYAHPRFFANGDWSDPVYNAQYALKIYQGRGNWTAWYAVQGILW